MKRKILEQTCFCIIIALVLFISKNSNTPLLEKGAESVLNYMKIEYTAEDVKKAVHTGSELVSALPAKVSGTIAVMKGKMTLGKTIDEEYENGRAAVYAAAGGEVTSVGGKRRNRQICQNNSWQHGRESVWQYGLCICGGA